MLKIMLCGTIILCILSYDEEKPFGDRTSEYVLHYQRFTEKIKIVDYSAHPPFHLPNENYLA